MSKSRTASGLNERKTSRILRRLERVLLRDVTASKTSSNTAKLRPTVQARFEKSYSDTTTRSGTAPESKTMPGATLWRAPVKRGKPDKPNYQMTSLERCKSLNTLRPLGSPGLTPLPTLSPLLKFRGSVRAFGFTPYMITNTETGLFIQGKCNAI